MRMVVCLFLLLAGCATHAVRCDARLVPINLPAAGSAGGAAVTPTVMPAATPATRRDP
jgi:hypothetical protein